MKPRLTNLLSLALAGILQLLPMLRSALPTLPSASSPTGALILRWAAGGVAYFGYHAISSASSIALSPSSATVGVPYSGTITYSGGHAGEVQSMSIAGVCLGSYSPSPGLTLTYGGGHTANLTGTPTSGFGTVPITLKLWDFGSCTGGLTDTQSTSLIIQNSGGGPVAPSMLVAPQSVVAQVGSDVILSGGASGNPTPTYSWRQGITVIPGATNNTLTIPAVQLTNSGVYTLFANNSQGQANSACYLTVALTPGSNILAFQYTNYVVAGTVVTMSSLITNVPSATNTYSWAVGTNGNSPIPGATNRTLTLAAYQTTPLKSGIYTVTFNSTVGSTPVVNLIQYNSYWTFGYLPSVTNQPAPVTVNSGSNATFNVTLAGSTYSTVFLYQNQTNLVAQTNLAAFNPPTATATTNVSLTLSNVTLANAGSYTFVVTNYWGSTTSSPAALTVTSSLAVTAPQSQTNYAGKSLSLSVTPSGTAPFSYQWQKGGVGLSNGGDISGATTNILGLAPAAITNSGSYRVVVTNSSGSVTSGVAVVSIVPVPQFALSFVSNSATLSAAGGVAGSNYVVQVSTNLANTNGWVSLKTNAVPLSGSITFTDTNTASSGLRFYRVLLP